MVSPVGKNTDSHCSTSETEAVLTCFKLHNHTSIQHKRSVFPLIDFIEIFKCFTHAGKMTICPQDVTQLHLPAAKTIIIIIMPLHICHHPTIKRFSFRPKYPDLLFGRTSVLSAQ